MDNENTDDDAPRKREVGARLASIRGVLGMRQVDFCRRFGLSQQKLSNWEKGINYPSVPLLIQLCEETGVTMDWFYRGILAGVSLALADKLREARVKPDATKAKPPGKAHPTTGKIEMRLQSSE